MNSTCAGFRCAHDPPFWTSEVLITNAVVENVSGKQGFHIQLQLDPFRAISVWTVPAFKVNRSEGFQLFLGLMGLCGIVSQRN